jgi:hypothetical protein
MLPNGGSTSGVAPRPAPPHPPSADAVARVFNSAFIFTDKNAEMMSKLPPRLKLWVTELAAYGADSLNFTWLEAMVNVLYETLLLLRKFSRKHTPPSPLVTTTHLSTITTIATCTPSSSQSL